MGTVWSYSVNIKDDVETASGTKEAFVGKAEAEKIRTVLESLMWKFF